MERSKFNCLTNYRKKTAKSQSERNKNGMMLFEFAYMHLPWREWHRRYGRQTKCRRKIYINQLFKVFWIIFSLFSQSEKEFQCVCACVFFFSSILTYEKKLKWERQRSSKKGSLCSVSITTSTERVCVWVLFSLHSRYGHIHKLIKMFNQSYAKKKSSSFFIELTAVLFRSSSLLLSMRCAGSWQSTLSSLFSCLTTFNRRTNNFNKLNWTEL